MRPIAPEKKWNKGVLALYFVALWVDLFAVADLNHEDAKHAILEVADDSAVAALSGYRACGAAFWPSRCN
jgi:hypothetical protein